MKDEMARDKAIEKLVADGLRRQAAAPSAQCLDAETLAAYVERMLTPEEKVSCEAHLSSCLRCQEQIAQLVRSSEGEAAVEPSSLAARSRPDLAGFRWAWAAPALVAVVVAGLWYTGEFGPLLRMRREAPAPLPSGPPPVAAPASADASAGRPARPQAQPAPSKDEQGEMELAKRGAKEEKKAHSNKIPAANRAGQNAGVGVGIERGIGAGTASEAAQDKLAPPAAAAGGAVVQHAEQAAAAAHQSRSVGQAVTGTIATPSERAGLARIDLRREVAPSAPSEPSPPKVAKEQESPQAGVAADQATRAEEIGARAKGAALSNTMKSFVPVPANWRVGPHGRIEKRSPEGNWVAVESGVEADLFAVSFPTPVIGWAVGAGGTVLLTTDGGTTWEKAAFPTTDDLVRVSARSDQVAWVWTRTGQSFLTSNRGRSWKRVR